MRKGITKREKEMFLRKYFNRKIIMESIPVRIQLQRKKGWTMPPNTVAVTRPGKWGNPFRVENNDVHHAVELYKAWLDNNETLQREAVLQLQGKNLACFCKIGEPCHADILLEIANK